MQRLADSAGDYTRCCPDPASPRCGSVARIRPRILVEQGADFHRFTLS